KSTQIFLDNEVFYSLLRQIYETPKSNLFYRIKRGSSRRKRNLSSFYEALRNAKNNNISSPNEQKLIVGGQAGNYSKKICVDLHQCLIAAITFAESGELEPLFSWEEDQSLVTV
ncbi:MAG: hypothetical protein ACK5GT_10810, partial [Aphanizomenon sp.]